MYEAFWDEVADDLREQTKRNKKIRLAKTKSKPITDEEAAKRIKEALRQDDEEEC